MRRFLTLVCLLCMAIPAGVSISGCTRNPGLNYCNGLGYGAKITDVASITLQPQTAGISLAYGQTSQVTTPTAYSCKNSAISVNSFTYGTNNNQLADISPTGYLCAGTWNRNTGGGIADYTYCTAPDPKPSTSGLPYSIAYITASVGSVTSNPVAVYIHATVTSISLVTTPLSGSTAQGCYSQNEQAQLSAQACYVSNGVQYELCAPSNVTAADYACAGGLAPGVTSVPTCGSSIGTLNFVVGTPSVASIDSTTNVITAKLPGTTAITAGLSQSASSAGYFSTCPPASIKVSLANGSTQGVVTKGVTQNLTTTVTDTKGNTITGLSLAYESTNPIDITATSQGSITTSYPGFASIYATCQPSDCNPSPINEIGLYGTGLSIASKPVGITVPGTTSDYVWFGAPGKSRYFGSIQLLTGNPGSTARLPYVPNSMAMDQQGNSLYFGTLHGLLIYSTSTNSLSTSVSTVPGVVLAVSPDNSKVIVNDQIQGLFYLYYVAAGTMHTYGGMGAAAAWTPDSSTAYIVDSAALGGKHTDRLYVFNTNNIWSTYDISATGGAKNLAVTMPGVGAYLSGNSTISHTWCPATTVGDNSTVQYYPLGDTVNIPTSVLGATPDGEHILGAALNGNSISLSDVGVTIPTTVCPGVAASAPADGGKLTALSTSPATLGSVNLTGVTTATAVNQIVTGSAPASTAVTTAAPIAFVTYTAASTSTTAAQLPFYLSQSSSLGQFGYVTLTGSTSSTPPTAPLAGTFSPDNQYFFVSTAGDNLVHMIKIPTDVSLSDPPTDSQQISPDLPGCDASSDEDCTYTGTAGTTVPATVITVKPRSIT
jgi:trimeric autotransporter adhesin